MEQQYSEGTELEKGTAINITVAKDRAPEPEPEPEPQPQPEENGAQ